jgi:hypothetical protein
MKRTKKELATSARQMGISSICPLPGPVFKVAAFRARDPEKSRCRFSEKTMREQKIARNLHGS